MIRPLNIKKKVQLFLQKSADTFRPANLALGIILLVTFFPLTQVGFTTNDDSNVYLHSLSWLQNGMPFSGALQGAGHFGRLYMLFTEYTGAIPYLLDSWGYYHFVAIGSLVLNVLLFSLVLKAYFRSTAFALFSATFFAVAIQNDFQHNLLTSYPVVFQVNLSFLFISLWLLIKHLERPNKKIYFASVGCFFISILTYEFFVAYGLLFALIAMAKAQEQESLKIRLVRTAKISGPYLLIILLYLAGYILFSMKYGLYSQGALSFDPAVSWRIISTFLHSSLPSYDFYHNGGWIGAFHDRYTGANTDTLDLIKSAQVEWLIKGFLASCLTLYSLSRAEKLFKIPSFFIFLLIAFYLMILPLVPISMMGRFQQWILRGTTSYTVNYFTFYGVVFLHCIVLFYFNSLFKKRRTLALIFQVFVALAVFKLSIQTDYANSAVIQSQALAHQKFLIVNQFLKTKSFQAIPSGSVIYAPALWKSISIMQNDGGYWTHYFQAKTQKSVTVISSPQALATYLPSSKQIYYLDYHQEPRELNQYLVFAKLKGSSQKTLTGLYTNQASIYSLSKNTVYRLTLKQKNNQNVCKDVFINQKYTRTTRQGWASMLVTDFHQEGQLRRSDISLTDLDLTQLGLSYYLNRQAMHLTSPISFPQGWSINEGDHRWAIAQQAQISIRNDQTHSAKYKIEFGLLAYGTRDIQISFQGKALQRVKFPGSVTLFSETLELAPGENVLKLSTLQPGGSPPNDGRKITFGITTIALRPDSTACKGENRNP